MNTEKYISPSLEEIGIYAENIMTASPYGMEDITSSGDIIEWEW